VNVLDMKGLSVSLDFQSISYMKQMLSMDQAHYPERLHKLIVINAPYFFSIVFAIFKPFIDARTLSKFEVLGSNYMTTLEKVVDKTVIPVEMGGDCKDVPWGGPFSEESGASHEQVVAYFLARFTEASIPDLLHPDEQESLRAANEVIAEMAPAAAAAAVAAPAATTVFTAAEETAASAAAATATN
jgi:hypothetical protein